MEKLKFEYSLKKIRPPSERNYKLQLTKNGNGNQTNEMESNFSGHQERKQQPAMLWITQF